MKVRMPLILIFTPADREPESNNGCGPLEKKKFDTPGLNRSAVATEKKKFHL
jgi:hypothetical protein